MVAGKSTTATHQYIQSKPKPLNKKGTLASQSYQGMEGFPRFPIVFIVSFTTVE